MTVSRRLFGMAAIASLLTGAPVAAQELALHGTVSISRFDASGTAVNPYDDDLATTGFGGFVRFRFGRFVLQPGVQVVTRGARISDTTHEDEQLRLEYLELPVLLVVPARLGSLEPFAFGGGMVAVETRCRYTIKDEGLRTNFGCDSPDSDGFDRNKADYGLVAGGGVSYPLAGGRIFVDARHTWGMRDIVDEDVDVELRNRTWSFSLGYTMMPPRPER